MLIFLRFGYKLCELINMERETEQTFIQKHVERTRQFFLAKETTEENVAYDVFYAAADTVSDIYMSTSALITRFKAETSISPSELEMTELKLDQGTWAKLDLDLCAFILGQELLKAYPELEKERSRRFIEFG